MSFGSNPFQVKVTGTAELRAVFKVLPETLVKRVVRKAARTGINKFKSSIKQNASKHGSALSSRVTSKVVTYRSTNVVYAVTGPVAGDPHAHLVEFGHRMVVGGTVPRIGVKAGKTPRARNPKNTGKGRVVGQVPPHPFVRPAEDANKASVLATVSQELVIGTKREIDRMLRA